MISILKKNALKFIDKFLSDRCDAMAAQVAFYIVISFVPFIMLLLSTLSSIKLDGYSILESLISRLPDTASSFLHSLFSKDSISTFGMVSVTAVTTLWSSSTAMFSIVKGLNDIFMIREKTNYWKARGISLIYTLAFDVAIVITIAINVFGGTVYNWLLHLTSFPVADFLHNIKDYFSFVFLFIFFTLTFKLIPSKAKVKFKFAVFGGLISTVGWLLFSFFFSVFVENFAHYASVYGSLAAIVVVMLWLYFCMYIMFFSGEIVAWLQFSSLRKELSSFLREKKEQIELRKAQRKQAKADARLIRKNKRNPKKYPLPERLQEAETEPEPELADVENMADVPDSYYNKNS